MRVQFLKDVTVEIVEPDTGDNDTYDRFIRSRTVIDIDEIIPLSETFSNFTVGDSIWINVRNDLFLEMV
jgi:hypothetical protein